MFIKYSAKTIRKKTNEKGEKKEEDQTVPSRKMGRHPAISQVFWSGAVMMKYLCVRFLFLFCFHFFHFFVTPLVDSHSTADMSIFFSSFPFFFRIRLLLVDTTSTGVAI